MLTIQIRTNKTTIIGQGDTVERETEPIYFIQSGQNTINLTAKEVEELKELLNMVKL